MKTIHTEPIKPSDGTTDKYSLVLREDQSVAIVRTSDERAHVAAEDGSYATLREKLISANEVSDANRKERDAIKDFFANYLSEMDK